MTMPLRVQEAAPQSPALPALQVIQGGISRNDVIDDLLGEVPHAQDHLEVMGRFKALGTDLLVENTLVYHPWRRTPMFAPGNTANIYVHNALSVVQQRELLARYDLVPYNGDYGGPLRVRVGKADYNVSFFSV